MLLGSKESESCSNYLESCCNPLCLRAGDNDSDQKKGGNCNFLVNVFGLYNDDICCDMYLIAFVLRFNQDFLAKWGQVGQVSLCQLLGDVKSEIRSR